MNVIDIHVIEGVPKSIPWRAGIEKAIHRRVRAQRDCIGKEEGARRGDRGEFQQNTAIPEALDGAKHPKHGLERFSKSFYSLEALQ